MRREYYTNRMRRNALPPEPPNVHIPAGAMNPRRRRNISVLPEQHARPYEFLLYLMDYRTAGKEYLVCPVCGNRVKRLFAFAHNEPEARYKFTLNDAACGYCASSKIAEDDIRLIDVKGIPGAR